MTLFVTQPYVSFFQRSGSQCHFSKCTTVIFLSRTWLCSQMKCSCPCGRPAGRPVPGSSLRILYVNDDGSFSLERSYQLSAASLDLSWWQLNTDQDCSLVEYWLGSGRKRLGLDAWTVELVSSMHAPADGHKNNSVEKCSASAQPLSPLLQTQNIWRCSSYYMQIQAWCKPRTQWTS